jgi:hypothetical protein
MAITFDTLPDELLEVVFECLAAPANGNEWPILDSFVESHLLQLDPTILRFCLASKRFHSIGQQVLPQLEKVQKYWSDDTDCQRRWAGYCAHIARDTFHAYTSHWERQLMSSWTPSLVSTITDLDIRLDTTANAKHFGDVFYGLNHLTHLNLEIYSSEVDVPDVAVHHAFFTGVSSLSGPYPRLRSFLVHRL